MSSLPRKPLIGVAVAAALPLAWFLFRRAEQPSAQRSSSGAVESSERLGQTLQAREQPDTRASLDTPSSSSAGTHLGTPSSAAPPKVQAKRNGEEANQLRERLTKLWQTRAKAQQAGTALTPPTSSAPRVRTRAEWMQTDYVKSVLREQYIPVAKDCYEQYLERVPRGAGNVSIDFSISGTPELGGVVDNVALGEETTITDEVFATCLRESMFALVLDAPPEEGRQITVGYALSFSPDPPEE